jgi:hypothetical protein
VTRWGYHLTTLGSVLLLAALVMLAAAALGLAAEVASAPVDTNVVPGRGVFVTPFPTAPTR